MIVVLHPTTGGGDKEQEKKPNSLVLLKVINLFKSTNKQKKKLKVSALC